MKQNIAASFPTPSFAEFWHDNCIQFKELPQEIMSHPYLIFRYKQDILTFSIFN